MSRTVNSRRRRRRSFSFSTVGNWDDCVSGESDCQGKEDWNVFLRSCLGSQIVKVRREGVRLSRCGKGKTRAIMSPLIQKKVSLCKIDEISIPGAAVPHTE